MSDSESAKKNRFEGSSSLGAGANKQIYEAGPSSLAPCQPIEGPVKLVVSNTQHYPAHHKNSKVFTVVGNQRLTYIFCSILLVLGLLARGCLWTQKSG